MLSFEISYNLGTLPNHILYELYAYCFNYVLILVEN